MPLTCKFNEDEEPETDGKTNTDYYPVCPNCSNVLTISRADASTKYPLGVNRFECRTCPYQYILKGGWTEKTPMKQKEVEDVFGGKEEFANADSMASKWTAAGILEEPWTTSRMFKNLQFTQLNVLPRTAMGTVRTSSSFRFEVQMSL